MGGDSDGRKTMTVMKQSVMIAVSMLQWCR